ncbi:MAG: hypothetical protein VX865_04000 [Candidatus Thermoplasmatota archaeon]|nr:hypothetical protein [Candidatus Thermoplasmatota archaeon]
MTTQRKSDTSSIILRATHQDAESICAGMVTESEFSLSGENMEFTLSSRSISDIRARWNSLLRGIVASEQALKAIRDSR